MDGSSVEILNGFKQCNNVHRIGSDNSHGVTRGKYVCIRCFLSKKCVMMLFLIISSNSLLAVKAYHYGYKKGILHFTPGRPLHSDTNSTSLGSILAMPQLHATTKSLTCPPLSVARCSFIQLSQLGRQWRERKCPNFETVAKGDSNPGSLDCESGILLLSYTAARHLRRLQIR